MLKPGRVRNLEGRAGLSGNIFAIYWRLWISFANTAIRIKRFCLIALRFKKFNWHWHHIQTNSNWPIFLFCCWNALPFWKVCYDLRLKQNFAGLISSDLKLWVQVISIMHVFRNSKLNYVDLISKNCIFQKMESIYLLFSWFLVINFRIVRSLFRARASNLSPMWMLSEGSPPPTIPFRLNSSDYLLEFDRHHLDSTSIEYHLSQACSALLH